MKNLLRMYVIVMMFLVCVLIGTVGLLTAGERSAHAVFGTGQETIRFDRTSLDPLTSFLPFHE